MKPWPLDASTHPEAVAWAVVPSTLGLFVLDVDHGPVEIVETYLVELGVEYVKAPSATPGRWHVMFRHGEALSNANWSLAGRDGSAHQGETASGETRSGNGYVAMWDADAWSHAIRELPTDDASAALSRFAVRGILGTRHAEGQRRPEHNRSAFRHPSPSNVAATLAAALADGKTPREAMRIIADAVIDAERKHEAVGALNPKDQQGVAVAWTRAMSDDAPVPAMRLRYVADRDTWHAYEDGRYQEHLAVSVPNSFGDWVWRLHKAGALDMEAVEALTKTGYNAAITTQAKGYLASRSDRWDADRRLVGLPDGRALRVTDTGYDVLSPDPNRLMAKALAVNLSGEGEAADWPYSMRIVRHVCGDDPDDEACLLAFLKLCLTGISRQCFLLLTGNPNTGKTTAMKLIRSLFGQDYSRQINSKLVASRHDVHDQWLLLSQYRVWWTNELGADAVLREDLKTIIDHVDITAEIKGGAHVPIFPQTHVIMGGNHVPKGIEDASDGYKRRLRPFVMDVEPEPLPDGVDLESELERERPAFLRRVLEADISPNGPLHADRRSARMLAAIGETTRRASAVVDALVEVGWQLDPEATERVFVDDLVGELARQELVPVTIKDAASWLRAGLRKALGKAHVYRGNGNRYIVTGLRRSVEAAATDNNLPF